MKRRHQGTYQQGLTTLLAALKDRAFTLTEGRGHMLGSWSPAKKKHGVGALKCDCLICGAGVIVSPKLPYQQNKGDPYHPGMKGEALFEVCPGLEMRGMP